MLHSGGTAVNVCCNLLDLRVSTGNSSLSNSDNAVTSHDSHLTPVRRA
jgi:hypothetical protein